MIMKLCISSSFGKHSMIVILLKVLQCQYSKNHYCDAQYSYNGYTSANNSYTSKLAAFQT